MNSKFFNAVSKIRYLALLMFLTLLSTNVWGAIADGTYVLCTSTADLEAGAHYIIASGISGTVNCISNVSNNNNRKTVSATVSSSKITVASNSTIMTFTLGGSSGAWTFYTDNYAGTAGYLASAASGSNNYCRVIATSTTGTISFSSNAAVINLNPHSSRTLLRYNSSASCFACYSSGQAAVYLYKKEAAAFTITATSSNNAHGTVEVSGTTITATPADCYQVVSGTGGYTVTTGTATVSHTGTSNTLTVTPSTNCTVQVNFEKKTVNTYIDEIQDNGEIEDCSTEAPSLSDKAAATSGTCAQQHYHFVGWVTAANKANPTDANVIEAGETVAVNGTTYYAVWAKGSGGGSFDGTAGGTFKIYADVNGTKYYATGTGSKINSTTNTTDASEYIFTKISDGVYSIKLGTDYIKYNSSTNLGTQSTSYSWTITAATYGSWRVTSETSGRAWIYRAGTTNQFGGYSTGNVNGTEYYDLEIGGSTSYSDYITTCCTSLGQINGPILLTQQNRLVNGI